MKVKSIVPILLLCLTTHVYGQASKYEYFFTANGNLYLPSSSTNKGVYPILWYDKTTDPKLLIGGFGVGVCVIMPIGGKIGFKGNANFSKHTYWDEPIRLTDVFGTPLDPYLAGSSDYTLGLIATIGYSFSKNLSVGTGIGSQILLLSLSRLPEIPNTNSSSSSSPISINKYYKPIMPVIPLELSLKLEKVLLNVRYEYGLLNRLKGDLAKYKTDNYSLLSFEIGFRIK